MDANLLYFLLGIIAIIPIDLLILPRLRKWQNDLPHINRKKKQKELRADLAYVEGLYKDRNKLIATAIANTTLIIILYVCSLTLLITSVFLLIIEARSSILHNLDAKFVYSTAHLLISNALIVLGYVFFIIGVNVSLRFISMLNRIKQYETFKQQTETRLRELEQGNSLKSSGGT